MAEGHRYYPEVRRAGYIRNLEDPHFKMHFRMDKATFEILVNVVAHERLRRGKLQRIRTDVGEATLMGLWAIFNKDTFRSTGLNFEHDMKSIHHHYKVLLEVLCAIGSRYIKWPNARQRQITANFYRRNFGLPGVAGSIDGTLIPITAPSEQRQRQPGSVHDCRVFRRSPLAKALFSRDDLLSPDEHLIGDGGYVCTSKIITPYHNDGHLRESHRHFNYKLSQCRATIERTNSLLKSRMARMEKLFCKDIITTNIHIAASAVLHNFILLRGEDLDGITIEGEVPNVNVEAAMEAARDAGFEKRMNIRLQLQEELEVLQEV
ncbi:Putative nuclease [Frankliniella fusca]|uniref:Nuclease n=1 Tax=Frankliniella fusca TaxID=407009 RepID=A0AAE1HFW8_9NEOP|nr:Putative nuclease [Frankliniella fusca]